MDRELRSDELNSILSLSKELRQQLQGLTRAGGRWMTRWYLPAKAGIGLERVYPNNGTEEE